MQHRQQYLGVICLLSACSALLSAENTHDTNEVRAAFEERTELGFYAFFQLRIVEHAMRPDVDNPANLSLLRNVSTREIRLAGSKMDYRSSIIEDDAAYFVPYSREAFNGKQSKAYHKTSRDIGTVSDNGSSYAPRSRVELRPLVLSYRPFDSQFRPIDLSMCEVSTHTELVSGVEAIRIRDISSGLVTQDIWVAPSQEYSIVRIVERYGGKDSFTQEIRNRQDDVGNWVPQSWKSVSLFIDTGELSTSTEVEVLDHSLGVSIPDEEFEIQFPEGTQIGYDDGKGGFSSLRDRSIRGETSRIPWLGATLALLLLLCLFGVRRMRQVSHK